MATFVTGKALMFTVGLTSAAARLLTLIETQFGLTLQDSWREVTIQPDPEGADAQSVRIGDSKLGTTATNGLVQKGVTLGGGDSETWTSQMNLVPAGSIFVQAVTGTPSINVQFIPY